MQVKRPDDWAKAARHARKLVMLCKTDPRPEEAIINVSDDLAQAVAFAFACEEDGKHR